PSSKVLCPCVSKLTSACSVPSEASAIVLTICLSSGFKTGKRRTDYAGAYLTTITTGNADIHYPEHPAFNHLKNVHTCKRVAKAKGRNEVVWIFPHCDRVQFLVAGNHRLVGATLIGLQGGSRCLSKSAETDRLGNDAFASHPSDLVIAVSLEQLCFHRRVRSFEPSVAEPTHAQGEASAVKGECSNHA